MRRRSATRRSAASRTSGSALLASAGVNTRSVTAPAHGRADTRRLVLWLGVVGVLILLAYGTRASSGKPDRQVLYHWSTAVGGLIQDAVVLAIVLLIARPQWE